METTPIQELATDPRPHQQTEQVRRSEHLPPGDDLEVSLWEGFIPDPVEPGELGLDGPSAAGDLTAGG